MPNEDNSGHLELTLISFPFYNSQRSSNDIYLTSNGKMIGFMDRLCFGHGRNSAIFLPADYPNQFPVSVKYKFPKSETDEDYGTIEDIAVNLIETFQEINDSLSNVQSNILFDILKTD
ncbi:hypothetical protein LPTSP3_g15040 [Leptospira kobayashii]|uniref:Uncharacterized protein n=1 Tax=Leptospira kobayashii TaxID=1917830 RepID=A0ABM7UIJ9_9LEPT|nr:hypothetical protein [Leptospira kobayashii]BDA78574.1 hypothetical protein LPTSP3_g15040 [Leptospira kobayashii]